MSNYPENWERDSRIKEYLPEDEIPKEYVIGRKYHMSWAQTKAMVWTLRYINNNNCVLCTKSGKILHARLSELREINEFRDKNYWNRIKNIH